ncbi:MAG: hypothetical protein GF400_09140, partial [Candidatus Eisenbacteria bacterium]|nr:hypothetical protein [Candidatus Eisenbacteria bacterium]
MLPKRDLARLIMTHYRDGPGERGGPGFERALREVADLGVGGCCVFGGELERTAARIGALREAARGPILVASDLERGLGQQVRGGTVFPSQMAVAAAERGMGTRGAGNGAAEA